MVRDRLARVGVAVVCIVPPADLATSDVLSVKALLIVDDRVRLNSVLLEHSVEYAILFGVFFVEAFALGVFVRRNRLLQGAYSAFEEHSQVRRRTMSRPRRVMSRVINAPLDAMSRMSDAADRVHKSLATRSRIARLTGGVTLDAIQTNLIGTNGVILTEMLAGKPPGNLRIARLAIVITVSWLALAECVRLIYQVAGPLQSPMDAVAYAIDYAVSVQSPLGITVLMFVGVTLMVTGWNIAAFQQERLATSDHTETHVDQTAGAPDVRS